MTVGIKIHVEPLPEGMWADVGLKNDAFVALYRECYPSLVALCRRLLCGQGDPEAIAQEAFVRAWCSLDRFTGARPFWPWVATIARRLCIDNRRRLGREAVNLHIEASVCERRAAPPDELVELDEDHRSAIEALRRLKPAEQRVITLRDVNGWSYDEIARFEGVTVESIRGSLKRARASLRRSYEKVSTGAPAAVAGSLKVLRDKARQISSGGTNHAPLAVSLNWVSELAMGAMVAMLASGAPVSSSSGAVHVGAVSVEAGATSAAPGGTAAAADPSSPGGVAAGETAGVAPPVVDSGGGGQVHRPLGVLPDDNGGTVAQVTFTDITTSPAYAQDGTIFASGVVTAGCPYATCAALFKSTDRGATWVRLPATGLTGGRVLLPPTYPQDPRLFATGPTGLQVSLDGGTSFATLAPVAGGAAISPRFAAGDPRIVFGAAPGWEYRDDIGAMRPGGFVMASTATAGSVAFVPSPGEQPVLIVGGTTPGPSGPSNAAVFRCDGSVCNTNALFENMVGAPEVAVSPHFASNRLVMAWRGSTLLRSVDGGLHFDPLALPVAGNIRSVAFHGPGRIVVGVAAAPLSGAVGGVFVSDDTGRTWTKAGPGTVLDQGVESVAATPDGRWLAGLTPSAGGGLLCSTDGGKQWAASCS